MEEVKAGQAVAIDNRGKRTRKYDNYDNKDQLEHQEIVTPEWLVDELLEYVAQAKTVLDPCVGPGAFLKGLDKLEWESDITAMDIQENHIEDIQQLKK